MLFLDSIYIASSCHFFLISICYHYTRYLYVILQWYWFIILDFIACSGYFRLCMYAWGIFSHIYVTDSRRHSIFAYFEKRGVTKLKKLHTQKYTISKNTSLIVLVFCMFGFDTCLVNFPKFYIKFKHVLHYLYIAILLINQYKIFWKIFETQKFS